jgi:type I restriction enzyme, S subunit
VSFPPYPSYQDSGVEWLGAVPRHWTVQRLGNLYREVSEAGSPELPVLSVSIHTGVSDEEAASEDNERKIVRSEDRSKYKRVSPNDLTYNMMRAWQGGFGTVQVEGMVSPAYVVARPRTEVPSRYIELLLRTPGAVEEMRRHSRGVTDFRLRLYWDQFKDIRVALPPQEERNAISAFVDRETTKIDALVEEQRRLIELLKDKRQAVISHAVTNGLHPAISMKDSGVGWLGNVPVHWKVLNLSRVVDERRPITYGIVQPGPLDASGRYMIRGQDYSRGWADPDTIFRVSPAVEEPYRRARLAAGDVVVTIVGAGTGNSAVVPATFAGANITQTTARVAPDPRKAESGYLALLFESRIGQIQTALYQKGAAQPGLNLEHLKAFRFPMPPLEEQVSIRDFVTEQLFAFSSLLSEAEAAVALLIERRAALISAAVTGKIDVRSAAPLQAQAA